MKRIDHLRAKLKAARSELRHKQRMYNSAERSMVDAFHGLLSCCSYGHSMQLQ